MKKLILILTILFSFSATQLFAEGGNYPQPKKIYHTVKKGETLWSISQRYGTTIKSILCLNSIKDATLIYPGDRILVLCNKKATYKKSTPKKQTKTKKRTTKIRRQTYIQKEVQIIYLPETKEKKFGIKFAGSIFAANNTNETKFKGGSAGFTIMIANQFSWGLFGEFNTGTSTCCMCDQEYELNHNLWLIGADFKIYPSKNKVGYVGIEVFYVRLINENPCGNATTKPGTGINPKLGIEAHFSKSVSLFIEGGYRAMEIEEETGFYGANGKIGLNIWF